MSCGKVFPSLSLLITPRRQGSIISVYRLEVVDTIHCMSSDDAYLEDKIGVIAKRSTVVVMALIIDTLHFRVALITRRRPTSLDAMYALYLILMSDDSAYYPVVH